MSSASTGVSEVRPSWSGLSARTCCRRPTYASASGVRCASPRLRPNLTQQRLFAARRLNLARAENPRTALVRSAAMATREAACHCGQLRLEVTGDPFVVSMCHCLACKRRTGSAFGMQAAFTPDQVNVVGRFSDYLRVSDEADRKEHVFHFCPDCGSQVFYTEPVGAGPDRRLGRLVRRPVLSAADRVGVRLATASVAGRAGHDRAPRRTVVSARSRSASRPGGWSADRPPRTRRRRRCCGCRRGARPAGDFLPGLSDHRVALERTGAALPREIDGGARERTADAAAPEARAGDEARHRPDAVVGLVLGAALPRDAGLEQQARIGGARLDRAPADGLAVEVGDEAARRRPPPGDRSRSACGTGRPAPRRRPRPTTPCAASCTAGTGTWTDRHACRAPPGDPPSSPRWQERS